MMIGYRFCPLDEQLVEYYLLKKANNEPFPDDCPVKDCDLYGEQEPWEIWDRYGGEHADGEFLYFFTNLKRRCSSRSRTQRKIGTGTWHGDAAGKPVMNRKKQIVGLITKFHYKNPNSVHNGGWLMREFSLVDQSRDCVLCCMKKNGKSKSGEKRKADEIDGDDVVDETDISELKRLMQFQYHDDDDGVRGRKQCLVEIYNVEPLATDDSRCESAKTQVGGGDGELNDNNRMSRYGVRVEQSWQSTGDGATVYSENTDREEEITAIEPFWESPATLIGDGHDMELAASSFDCLGYENWPSLDNILSVGVSLPWEVDSVLEHNNENMMPETAERSEEGESMLPETAETREEGLGYENWPSLYNILTVGESPPSEVDSVLEHNNQNTMPETVERREEGESMLRETAETRGEGLGYENWPPLFIILPVGECLPTEVDSVLEHNHENMMPETAERREEGESMLPETAETREEGLGCENWPSLYNILSVGESLTSEVDSVLEHNNENTMPGIADTREEGESMMPETAEARGNSEECKQGDSAKQEEIRISSSGADFNSIDWELFAGDLLYGSPYLVPENEIFFNAYDGTWLV